MHYDEVISNFLEKDKKILYVGTHSTDIINTALTPSELHFLNKDSFPLNDTTVVPSKLDYVIFTDALELVDNPKEIISQLKWNSEQVIVYEFKRLEDSEINTEWKHPWANIGLENFLTWEFDYVRSIYLGYATVYFCTGPNNIQPEELNKE
jgi:hypothetical protein